MTMTEIVFIGNNYTHSRGVVVVASPIRSVSRPYAAAAAAAGLLHAQQRQQRQFAFSAALIGAKVIKIDRKRARARAPITQSQLLYDQLFT